MPQSAGYDTTLKVGGSPTALTNAPTTKITANTVYRIADASKRILDPDEPVVVESDPLNNGTWGVITPSAIDYFTGTVTVADQGASAVVRVSGKYVPLVSVAFARSASFAQSADSLDVTDFDSGGWREYLLGLQRGELSFELVSDAADNLGPGSLRDALASRTTVLVEYQPGGQGRWYRFWARLSARDTGAPIDGLVTSNITAIMTTRPPAAGFSLSDVASD